MTDQDADTHNPMPAAETLALRLSEGLGPTHHSPERLRFERWYDAQPEWRLNPWDVWQAGAQDAAAEIARLRAALADVVDTDWAYLKHDADTARPDSLYNRVRRGRLALGPNVRAKQP